MEKLPQHFTYWMGLPLWRMVQWIKQSLRQFNYNQYLLHWIPFNLRSSNVSKICFYGPWTPEHYNYIAIYSKLQPKGLMEYWFKAIPLDAGSWFIGNQINVTNQHIYIIGYIWKLYPNQKLYESPNKILQVFAIWTFGALPGWHFQVSNPTCRSCPYVGIQVGCLPTYGLAY